MDTLEIPINPLLYPILKDTGNLSRLTVVHHTYHQRPYEQATTTENSWEQLLHSKARPLIHDLEVDREWIIVPYTECGWLILQNLFPTRLTYPTNEERTSDASKIIEVSFNAEHPVIKIHTGGSAEFAPISNVYVRCLNGATRIVATVYPR